MDRHSQKDKRCTDGRAGRGRWTDIVRKTTELQTHRQMDRHSQKDNRWADRQTEGQTVRKTTD